MLKDLSFHTQYILVLILLAITSELFFHVSLLSRTMTRYSNVFPLSLLLFLELL